MKAKTLTLIFLLCGLVWGGFAFGQSMGNEQSDGTYWISNTKVSFLEYMDAIGMPYLLLEDTSPEMQEHLKQLCEGLETLPVAWLFTPDQTRFTPLCTGNRLPAVEESKGLCGFIKRPLARITKEGTIICDSPGIAI